MYKNRAKHGGMVGWSDVLAVSIGCLYAITVTSNWPRLNVGFTDSICGAFVLVQSAQDCQGCDHLQ